MAAALNVNSAAAGGGGGDCWSRNNNKKKKTTRRGRRIKTSSSSSSCAAALALAPAPIVVTGNPPTFVSAPGRRIIAIGDLHGDLSQARCALQLAGLLSSSDHHLHGDLWTGGHDVLVQLGDILDRGPHELALLSLFRSLHLQALSQGGAVFLLNGNHETMNVEGDFRYVHPHSFHECTQFLHFLDLCGNNWDQAFLTWIAAHSPANSSPNNNLLWPPWGDLVKKPKGVIARSLLLRPGGLLARELARHPVALKVNDWIFCHGGLLPHHVEYGLERLNRDVSHWMSGRVSDTSIPFIATRGYDSVVWNRLYSRDTSDLDDYQIRQIHSTLQETLQAVGAKAMVVGHTPQYDGVNCKYDSSIWRVDVGMSSGVLNSRPEVLEIIDNKARVLRSNKETFSELQLLDYT